jgi:hypothetical protein
VKMLTRSWEDFKESRYTIMGALTKLKYDNLGRWTGDRITAGTPKEPKDVVGVMLRAMADKDMAQAGVQRLSELSLPEGGEMVCVEAGAVDALCAAMELHGKVVCSSAADALANIACGPAAAVRDCVERGAPRALVSALQYHRDDFEVAAALCHAVANIAAREEIGKVAFMEHSTVAAVLGVIAAAVAGAPAGAAGDARQHACQHACTALWNISVGSDERKDAIMRREVGALGALCSVLAAFPDGESACEAACGALRSLATKPAFRGAIMAALAAPLLAAAAAAHAPAKVHALAALSDLGLDEMGGSRLTLDALLKELDNSVFPPAGVALAHLTALVDFTGGRGEWDARNDKLRRAGADMETRCAECIRALPFINRALDTHRNVPQACEAACTVIRNLTGANDTLCMQAKVAIAPVLSVFRLHAESAPICRVACGALMNLATPPNRAHFSPAATVVLQAVIKDHPEAREFATCALQKLGEREAAEAAAAKARAGDAQRQLAKQAKPAAHAGGGGGGGDSSGVSAEEAARFLDRPATGSQRDVTAFDRVRFLVALPDDKLAFGGGAL